MSADGNSSICIQEQVHPHSTVNLMSRPREQNDYYYCPKLLLLLLFLANGNSTSPIILYLDNVMSICNLFISSTIH